MVNVESILTLVEVLLLIEQYSGGEIFGELHVICQHFSSQIPVKNCLIWLSVNFYVVIQWRGFKQGLAI